MKSTLLRVEVHFCVYPPSSMFLSYLLYVEVITRRMSDTWNERFQSKALWWPLVGSPFHGQLLMPIWKVDVM